MKNNIEIETVNVVEKVLAFEWHVNDNWYGKNYRAVLHNVDNTSFTNAKETIQYRSLFSRYIKSKFKDVKPTMKGMRFGEFKNFITFKYVSFGPSYSCTNYNITVEQLIEFGKNN